MEVNYHIDINFSKVSLPEEGTIVYFVDEDGKLPAAAVDVDKKTGGAVTKAIQAGDFKGKEGKFLTILATVGLELDRIILAGIGADNEDGDDNSINRNINIGSKLYKNLNSGKVK